MSKLFFLALLVSLANIALNFLSAKNAEAADSWYAMFMATFPRRVWGGLRIVDMHEHFLFHRKE